MAIWKMEWEEVKKSLWHAFDVLDTTSHLKKIRTAQVPKTKLRVLTNNLGHLLSVEQAETIWDKVPKDNIDFDQFIDVLNKNLLVGLDKHSGAKLVGLISEIDNLCWMLCENVYRQRILDDTLENGENHVAVNGEKNVDGDYTNIIGSKQPPRIFCSGDCFKLWKIFNFLVERAEDKSLLFPLLTDIEEAERIASEICQTVGLPLPKVNPNQRRGSTDILLQSFLIDFSDFVKVIVKKITKDNDTRVISHGISEVYNQIMYDIVRKGYMVKFGNKVTAWKERWFVLNSSELKYYTNAEEKDLKGSIALCQACFTQSFPDKPGGRHHRFKLHTPGKHYELSAPDLKSKNEWMADIKIVVSHIGTGPSKDSLQLAALKERKKEREERRRRTAEEELNRCAEREKLLERERQLEEERRQRQLAQEEILERERLLALERQKRAEEEERRRRETNELLDEKKKEIDAERQRCADTEARLQAEREALMQQSKEELEAEREQRALVEARLREEEAQLEEERRRLKELEEAKAALEAMVEMERALKKDEEIVRNLQARILEEEYAKREELERLQAEQNKKLMEEQLTRQELEAAHRLKEEALRLAKEQLEALTREREMADQQLRDAAEKLKQAEIDRQKIQERMKLKAMTSSSRMAGPIRTPDPNPFVTHRGLGAFTEADFQRRQQSQEEENSNMSSAEQNLSNSTQAITLQTEL
ncbi:switch-associated protein 70-like isoform X3 [Biomphalaria glabrata]|uniref:Switch-associated protein 70-like isoform X3 n=1 Tax=Biomphalaria glabrata TaxID=6526 RepID=A0A9W2YFH2_BIOGL|nr:switch-associated protein 70-like isoform X3 [Biomphalaria glabrata]